MRAIGPWLLILLAGCLPQKATGTDDIVVRGSDSEVNVVQRLAEAYMADHPGVDISVTGGGSGTGIAALLDGTTDIANASRAFEPHEKLFAIRRGVDPVPTIFATDALTVIVHPDNPVAALTSRQIGAIYRGEIDSWAGLGGDGKVVAYGRQSSSGTYVFFRDAVLEGDFGPHVREMNGNAQIIEAVAADPGAIGYVAAGYLRSVGSRVKALAILPADGGSPVHPDDTAAVIAGRYPMTRPLYQYTNGNPTGAVRDFLLFELSEPGEALVTEMGFYPLVDAWRDRNRHLSPTARWSP